VSLSLRDLDVMRCRRDLEAMWHRIAEEGRGARAAGLKIEDCPPFRDDDMTASWRIGWRDEDERRARHG